MTDEKIDLRKFNIWSSFYCIVFLEIDVFCFSAIFLKVLFVLFCFA